MLNGTLGMNESDKNTQEQMQREQDVSASGVSVFKLSLDANLERTWLQRFLSAVGMLLGLGDDAVTHKLIAPSGSVSFPSHVLRGTLGELARELSRGTEIPEEFVFASALTCLGSIVSGHLTLNLGLESDTRLYTVLLGTSYNVRKSTALKKTLEFFRSLQCAWPLSVSYGVASAEGLLETL